MNGDEELHGKNKSVGGTKVDFVQKNETPAAATPAAATPAATTPAAATPTAATPAATPAANAPGADGGLKDVKITVAGDRVSGMNGDETVHGPATVTGTKVIFNKKAVQAPTVAQTNTHSNGVSKTDEATI